MTQAEFDTFADEYHAQHSSNVRLSGEAPEFFAEYKITTLARVLGSKRPATILDFGCGVGNSVPFFRRYFPGAELTCVDVSERSIALAKERFPGSERYCLLQDGKIPFPDASFDLVFTACVFHHIEPALHIPSLIEIRRVTKAGGNICIFEHNPYNPVTVRMVNTCPFDKNAQLISARTFAGRLRQAGWREPVTRYNMFFPKVLGALRAVEPWLEWLPLGGQYSLIARR